MRELLLWRLFNQHFVHANVSMSYCREGINFFKNNFKRLRKRLPLPQFKQWSGQGNAKEIFRKEWKMPGYLSKTMLRLRRQWKSKQRTVHGAAKRTYLFIQINQLRSKDAIKKSAAIWWIWISSSSLMLVDFSKDTIMQLQSRSRQLCGHGLVEEKYWTENTKNTMSSFYVRRMLQSHCKQYFGDGDAKKSWHRRRLELTRLIGTRTCLLQ